MKRKLELKASRAGIDIAMNVIIETDLGLLTEDEINTVKRNLADRLVDVLRDMPYARFSIMDIKLA